MTQNEFCKFGEMPSLSSVGGRKFEDCKAAGAFESGIAENEGVGGGYGRF